MSQIRVTVLALGTLLAVQAGESAWARADGDEKPEKKQKPRFTIGRETTYVTGPLDADGYIDYAAALNERLSKGVTPENNANVLLWMAIGPSLDGKKRSAEFFKQMGMPPPPAKGDYFIDLQQYLKEHAKLESGEPTAKVLNEVDSSVERAWTAERYPHFAGWLQANEKPLALVSEATQRPRFFSPWWYETSMKGPPGLQDSFPPRAYLACALALTARAMLALGEERYDAAWRDLLASHRLGRLVTHFGNGGGWSVSIAIDMMAHKGTLAYLDQAKPSAQRLRECQRDLQELPERHVLADTLDVGERMISLNILAQLERYGLGHLLDFFGAQLRESPDPLAKQHLINWDTALRTANYWQNRLAAAARVRDRSARNKLLDQIRQELPPFEKYWKDGPLVKELLGPGKNASERGKLLAGFLFPMATYRKYLDGSDRTEQNRRNLTLAIALASYHRDHGRYPKTLEALAPDYLPKIPQDLFGARSLTYRPSENGYLLYSVGVNGKDDGGRTYGDEPYGSDDLVVRMPLARQR